jgi:ribosomal protein L30E
MTNEYGQGDFKKIMAALAERFGAKSNSALMEEGAGADVLVATNIQTDKKDKTKKYLRIDTLVVE